MSIAMRAEPLPIFQRKPHPRPLPRLPREQRPTREGDYVNTPATISATTLPSGIVVKIRKGRALVDHHGRGRHWYDLADVRRGATPNEVIEDHIASRPPVIVIPCGRRKRDEPSRAGDLYLGSQHRLAREAADVLAADTGGRVVILSALHGLVDLDRVLDPYDVTIGDERAVTAEDVKWQLVRMGATRVIALTPNGYTDLLRSPWVRLDDRLAGCRGIGDQRAVLARIKRGSVAA